MKQNPRAGGARGSEVDPAGRHRNPTAAPCEAQPTLLPRCLFRKIIVEQTCEGWRARIVGFDAKFWNGATSSTFKSRRLAVAAANAASRQCGLPVVTVETLTAADGPPDLAA